MPTPQETAEYTYDMLVALKGLAASRGQETLALLLDAAADEARALLKDQHNVRSANGGET